ncbi:envelope polyprotein [Bovine immunodeficiency virus]|uniref:Envelope glycoprotein n=4 Tax=Bovine immunodeficiency virus TaxID=11657 RepID=ENV_BIV29|nr:envelope polyprotein [Bovine immunodeficiency virus]P19557.1 RecName: Full=Envelope glycoprotein; AltName: Full=Env polyprotein; Contains: RecName: Full=Surface protein; Short=SU; AltName: Full=Glycoprotein 62; Short=gp62; Contains: RecName: Full=Transmembrane protein; Short=TM; AltName: Full=Glycoprotein 40; Short=gp40 [Bovine immunodeficiency virus R29]AAA91274.1 envelope polyprotein [Bovine immunodeficiency virus]
MDQDLDGAERGERGGGSEELLQEEINEGRLTAREALQTWINNGEIHPWVLAGMLSMGVGMLLGVYCQLPDTLIWILMFQLCLYWGLGETSRELDKDSWQWVRSVFIIAILGTLTMAGTALADDDQSTLIPNITKIPTKDTEPGCTYPWILILLILAFILGILGIILVLRRSNSEDILAARDTIDWWLSANQEIPPKFAFPIILISSPLAGIIGYYVMERHLEIFKKGCQICGSLSSMWGMLLEEIGRWLARREWNVSRVMVILLISFSWGMYVNRVNASGSHVAMVTSPPGYRIVNDTSQAPWYCFSSAPIPTCSSSQWGDKYFEEKINETLVKQVYEQAAKHSRATWIEPDLLEEAVYELALLSANDSRQVVVENGTDVCSSQNSSTNKGHPMTLLKLRGQVSETWIGNSSLQFCVQWPYVLVGLNNSDSNISFNSGDWIATNCMHPITLNKSAQDLGKNFPRLTFLDGQLSQLKNTLCGHNTNCLKFGNKSFSTNSLILCQDNPIGNDTFYSLSHSFSKQASARWILVKVPSYGFVVVNDTDTPPSLRIRKPRAVGLAIFLLVLAIMAITSSLVAATTLVNQHTTAKVVERVVQNVSYIAQTQDQFTHLFRNINNRLNVLHHRVSYLEYVEEIRQKQVFFGCKPHGRYCHFDFGPEEVGWNNSWNSKTWNDLQDEYDKIEEKILKIRVDWLNSSLSDTQDTFGLETSIFDHLVQLFDWTSWKDWIKIIIVIIVLWLLIKILLGMLRSCAKVSQNYQHLPAEEEDGDTEPESSPARGDPASGSLYENWLNKIGESKNDAYRVWTEEYNSLRILFATCRWDLLTPQLLQLPFFLLTLLLKLLWDIFRHAPILNLKGWTVGQGGTSGQQQPPDFPYVNWTGSREQNNPEGGLDSGAWYEGLRGSQ